MAPNTLIHPAATGRDTEHIIVKTD